MKNNVVALLLGLSVALPAVAQDEMMVDDSASFEEAAPVEEAAVEEVPADEGVAEEAVAEDGSTEAVTEDMAAEAPADDAATLETTDYTDDGTVAEDASAETSFDDGSGEVAADDGYTETTGETAEPLKMYVGLDKAWTTVSFSSDSLAARFGGDEFDSEFYRVRVGVRVFDAIALEAQVGIADQKGSEAGKYETAEYYGVYLVPTGVLFDLIEVAAPVGYSMTTIERGSASEDIDGVSFGLNFEIPLLTGVDWFPDVRIGGGGTVYQAEKKSRVYGYHAGLRFDFGV